MPILCGGNVDMYLLGQIVAKGLGNMGRMVRILVTLKDKPGALKEIVDEISSLSVNIVEVIHDRLSSVVNAGTVGVTLSLETENQEHADRLIAHLTKKNIHKRYELIKSGEKLHFTYLTTPNPINENVISFMNVLPKEFDLHKYIDYDMQFDKSFIEPLKVVIEKIGWNVEPVASLDSFFG